MKVSKAKQRLGPRIQAEEKSVTNVRHPLVRYNNNSTNSHRGIKPAAIKREKENYAQFSKLSLHTSHSVSVILTGQSKPVRRVA